MSFLPGYDHDVFVSYAHGPRTSLGRDPISQWSQQLVGELTGLVTAKLGSKQRILNVWMDPQLQNNHSLTSALRSHVEGSAILLVIMSEYYLASPVCRQEVEWFRARAATRCVPDRRIFVVHAWATQRALWSNVTLHDYDGVGYSFVPKDDEQADPFGYPCINPSDHDYPAYKAACSKLVRDLAAEFHHIERLESDDASPRPSSKPQAVRMPTAPVSSGATAGSPRSVLLGFMNETLQDDRNELRAKLESAKIAVLPPTDEDPVDEESLRRTLETYGKSADALMLIANEYPGMWPKGDPSGFVGHQIRWATDAGLPCYLWLRIEDTAKVRNAAYREYVETLSQRAVEAHMQLRHDGLDGFVTHIRTSILGSAHPEPGVEQLAVICSNFPEDPAMGERFRDAIREVVRQTNREIFLFDFSDNHEHIKLAKLGERIREADTVLVLCFDQAWNWARMLIKEISGLDSHRAGDKAQFLIAGPNDKHDCLYDASVFGFKTVDALHVGVDELKHRLTREIVAALPRPASAPPPGSAA